MIGEIVGGVAVFAHGFYNYYSRIPVFSRMYFLLPVVAGSIYAGHTVENRLAERGQVRMAAIEHYKSTFPDRVPDESIFFKFDTQDIIIGIITYGDIIKDWSPKR